MSLPDREDPMFVQSVEKAFQVLGAFNAEHPTMNLTQVATATGMARSAAQRFLHTLVKLGYLEKDPASKQFRLTPRILRHASHFAITNPIVRMAMPYVIDLRRDTNEAVSLTMLDDTESIFAVRLLSGHSLGSKVVVGTHVPVYCTASGLAMLSRLPEEEALAILHRSDLRKFTVYTEIEIPAIMERLRSIRAKGYVVCVDEYLLNDITIAAAIRCADGTLAAVNIATTKERHTPEEAEAKYAHLVTGLAQLLSNA